jgi:hypothetical protein
MAKLTSNFWQRWGKSRKTWLGALALAGLVAGPVSTSFAQEYYPPSGGYDYPAAAPAYGGGYDYPAPPVVVARPPQVVYAPPAVEYRPAYRPWAWHRWHRGYRGAWGGYHHHGRW